MSQHKLDIKLVIVKLIKSIWQIKVVFFIICCTIWSVSAITIASVVHFNWAYSVKLNLTLLGYICLNNYIYIVSVQYIVSRSTYTYWKKRYISRTSKMHKIIMKEIYLIFISGTATARWWHGSQSHLISAIVACTWTTVAPIYQSAELTRRP